MSSETALYYISPLEDDFQCGLEVGAILRRLNPFSGEKNVGDWIKDLQKNFEQTAQGEIATESDRVSKDISAEMLTFFNQLVTAIESRKNSLASLPGTSCTGRDDILSRLSSQLRNLRVADIVDAKGSKGKELGNLTLTGGGLATLGVLIAHYTSIVIFDFTGGALAIAGASIIAATLLWKRIGIIKDFKRNMAKSRDDFRGRIDQEISGIFDKMFFEINDCFEEPVRQLNEKENRLTPLLTEAKQLLLVVHS